MAVRVSNPSLGAAGDGLRLPPHSIEAEQSVLGGLMIDSAAWDQVADRVLAEDFYRNDHRLIFAAAASLIERNQPCDAVTLSGHLESQGVLDQVGGLAYLGTLARDTPTAANIRAYADIVRERSILRQLISAGNSIVGSALEPEGREAREIVDDAERAVFEIAERGSRGKVGFRLVKAILPDVVSRIDEMYHSEGKLTGISTGFKQLDEKTSGLQAGDLIIIAGRPSMGKTTLAVNIAEYAALGAKKSAAHLQHGNVGRVAHAAHAVLARPHQSEPSSLRAPRGRRLGAHRFGHDAAGRREASTSTRRRRSRPPKFARAHAA